MSGIDVTDLVVWYIAFVFSVSAHEAAHALAAMVGGDLTAYYGGQVSLNPLPHIKRSPIGTVVVPLLSYLFGGWMIGWASAPYNRQWAERYPRRAAWMAAAGPAANLLIVLVSFLIIKLGLLLGIFTAPNAVSFSQIIAAASVSGIQLARLLSIFFMLNLILFIFNLFPFPPLDGSQVITLLMGDELANRFRSFMSQPAMSFLGLVLAWKMFGKVFVVIFSLVLKLIHPGINYH